MKGVSKGVILATTMAALVATGYIAPVSAAEQGQVKCKGVNSCKGQSDCKMPGGSCKGQNNCKGQGLKYETSEEACKKAGGEVMS